MLCFVCVNDCPQKEHTHNIDSRQSWEPQPWTVVTTCCRRNLEIPAGLPLCVGTRPNAQRGGEWMWRLWVM